VCVCVCCFFLLTRYWGNRGPGVNSWIRGPVTGALHDVCILCAKNYCWYCTVAEITLTLYADKRRHGEIHKNQTKTWKSNVNVIKMLSKHTKKSLWGSSTTMQRSMNRSVHAIGVIRVWNMRGFSPVLHWMSSRARKKKNISLRHPCNKQNIIVEKMTREISNRIPLSQIKYTNVQHGDGRDWIVVQVFENSLPLYLRWSYHTTTTNQHTWTCLRKI